MSQAAYRHEVLWARLSWHVPAHHCGGHCFFKEGMIASDMSREAPMAAEHGAAILAHSIYS